MRVIIGTNSGSESWIPDVPTQDFLYYAPDFLKHHVIASMDDDDTREIINLIHNYHENNNGISNYLQLLLNLPITMKTSQPPVDLKLGKNKSDAVLVRIEELRQNKLINQLLATRQKDIESGKDRRVDILVNKFLPLIKACKNVHVFDLYAGSSFIDNNIYDENLKIKDGLAYFLQAAVKERVDSISIYSGRTQQKLTKSVLQKKLFELFRITQPEYGVCINWHYLESQVSDGRHQNRHFRFTFYGQYSSWVTLNVGHGCAIFSRETLDSPHSINMELQNKSAIDREDQIARHRNRQLFSINL